MTDYSYHKCPVCTVEYAVQSDFMEYRRTAPKHNKNRHWYCPNGHELVFTKSAHEREKERRKWFEQRLKAVEADLETAKRSRNAYKGHVTRLSKKLVEGSCPVCSERFPALEEHMREEHPDWVEPEVESGKPVSEDIADAKVA